MRTYALSILALACVLTTTLLFGQASNQRSTTTTTTTTTQITATGPEHNIEGCVVREGSDFFLLPQRGAPFKIQSSQDLSANDGHRVMVSGKETALTTTNNAGATAAAGNAGELHTRANRQLVADSVRSIANTCAMNWNPSSR
jgi:hypothetical protein